MKQITNKEMQVLIKEGKIYPFTFNCQKFDDNDNLIGMYRKTILNNLVITKSKYYTMDKIADELRSRKNL